MSSSANRIAVCLAAVISLATATAASATSHLATSRMASGTYRATVHVGPTVYRSTWKVSISKSGKVTGKSYWTCCPGKRTDPLTGHVSGSRAVIVRHCSGQGAPYCLQTYTGTASGGTVRGSWSGSGVVAGASTFALTRVA